MKAAPVTPEQLHLAFRQLRRPHWPDDLDAALADRVYGPCIRGLAHRLGRRQLGTPPTSAPPRAALPDPNQRDPHAAARIAARRRLPHLTHDPRRAAANDLFDDE